MTYANEALPQNDLLMALCHLKARTPVIRDLTPDGVPESFIKVMYERINGTHAPQGQLPSGLREFMKTPRRRLQASVAVRTFKRFEFISEDNAWRYIDAFNAYRRVFGNNTIYDFTRIWFLFRQYQLGRVVLTACPRCGCHYVYNREDVSDRTACCGCHFKKQAKAKIATHSERGSAPL